LTQTIAVLSFNQLVDGIYSLGINASLATDYVGQQLDGDNDGLAGGNYTFSFHRLFGDSNGDGAVTAIDFNAFRLAYGTSGPSIFDFDNNGSVSAIDFNEFRLRYGVMI
jgi:hypothetical protein